LLIDAEGHAKPCDVATMWICLNFAISTAVPFVELPVLPVVSIGVRQPVRDIANSKRRISAKEFIHSDFRQLEQLRPAQLVCHQLNQLYRHCSGSQLPWRSQSERSGNLLQKMLLQPWLCPQKTNNIKK
jgi:hypothetical protein